MMGAHGRFEAEKRQGGTLGGGLQAKETPDGRTGQLRPRSGFHCACEDTRVVTSGHVWALFRR